MILRSRCTETKAWWTKVSVMCYLGSGEGRDGCSEGRFSRTFRGHTHLYLLFQSDHVQCYPKSVCKRYGTALLQPALRAELDRCGRSYPVFQSQSNSKRAEKRVTPDVLHIAHVYRAICCENRCAIAEMAITANTQPLKLSGTVILLYGGSIP